jgi:hypothetical protein
MHLDASLELIAAAIDIRDADGARDIIAVAAEFFDVTCAPTAACAVETARALVATAARAQAAGVNHPGSPDGHRAVLVAHARARVVPSPFRDRAVCVPRARSTRPDHTLFPNPTDPPNRRSP